MVSLFGRGFDSLQLHFVAPSRGLTLVRVLCIAKRPFGPSATPSSSTSLRPREVDSLATSYIGWPTSRLLSLMIDGARVVQGERRAELARAMLSRSPHSQSISLMLCKGTIFFAHFQISSLQLDRFLAQNRPIRMNRNTRCSNP